MNTILFCVASDVTSVDNQVFLGINTFLNVAGNVDFASTTSLTVDSEVANTVDSLQFRVNSKRCTVANNEMCIAMIEFKSALKGNVATDHVPVAIKCSRGTINQGVVPAPLLLAILIDLRHFEFRIDGDVLGRHG